MLTENISEFIANHEVLTLACSENEKPYCFNCYYAFVKDEGLLVFKSTGDTTHDRILALNAKVSGTILPEKINMMSLKGLQFTGEILPAVTTYLTKASAAYYLKYPFSLAMPGHLKIIQLNWAKLTDNSKGFGHKEKWERV